MLPADERWKRVKELFERALEQEPADLDEWLDKQGETDEQIRSEALSLLEHNSKVGSFLVDPIADRF